MITMWDRARIGAALMAAGLGVAGVGSLAMAQSAPPVERPVEPLAAAPADHDAPGRAVFVTYCASCHQNDGQGAPNFAPSLVGSAVLGIDRDGIVNFLRAGANSGVYIGGMPSFDFLPQAELEAIAAYVAKAFSGKAAGDANAPEAMPG